MSIAQHMIEEFNHEMETTKRFFNALTDDILPYRPHKKSMSVEELANHILRLPRFAINIIEKEALDWAVETFPENPKNTAAMNLMFDNNLSSAKQVMTKLGDKILTESWSMKNGDTVYFTMPKRMAIRKLVLNHTVHHRAQLGVYLRMNNISVPASYGQSADEKA